MKTWYSDPASNRQLKVLQFFGFSIDEHITKGVASRIITDLFRHHDKRSVWEKYVYLTGDVGQESPNLLPFDPAQIESTIVPDDWQPPRPFSKQNGSERPIRASRHKGEHTRHIQMALDILKEGIPFDDPVPVIEYGGRRFCFTGKFSLGTRQWCEAVSYTHLDVYKRQSGPKAAHSHFRKAISFTTRPLPINSGMPPYNTYSCLLYTSRCV